MNYISILLFSLVFFSSNAIGQTFKEQFNSLVSSKDTLGQRKILEEWHKSDSIDPELFVSYFNYFIRQSKKEVIRLDKEMKGTEGLQIMDTDSTVKDPVGYLYSELIYDEKNLKKAYDVILKGIEKHPNRLDMRFGIIYLYGQNEVYDNFTSEIIRTINYSRKNNNKWLWTDNKTVDNPKVFMLEAIQDYQLQLYNTESDDLLENMKLIAEAVLTHYPDHIESLSNLSVVLLLQKKYDLALEPLLRAEKLAPEDYIVLSNIAQAYKLKGDNTNAIKYYELVIKYGNEEVKEYAKSQIEILKKK